MIPPERENSLQSCKKRKMKGVTILLWGHMGARKITVPAEWDNKEIEAHLKRNSGRFDFLLSGWERLKSIRKVILNK